MSDPLFRQRYRVLQDVIRDSDLRLDGEIPRCVPGLREMYEDDVELIGAIQMRWYTRLSGRIEVEQGRRPDLAQAVVIAWQLTRADLPGARMVLDRAAETPTSPEMGMVLTKARRNEHIMLALMAGLASFRDDRAADLGARLEENARKHPEFGSHNGEAAGGCLAVRLAG